MTLKENLGRLEGYLKLLDKEIEQAGIDAEKQEAALLRACRAKCYCDIDDPELENQCCNLEWIKEELEDAGALVKDARIKMAKAVKEAFYL